MVGHASWCCGVPMSTVDDCFFMDSGFCEGGGVGAILIDDAGRSGGNRDCDVDL